jgi:LuxR family maltose regulon positive regulatory protein
MAIDTLDNDPARFWTHLLAAIARARGDKQGAVLGADPAGRVLDQLDRLHVRWLVLDDLHLLTGPAVLADLARLVDLVGPGSSIVLATRYDPAPELHVARLRATGRLVEIDESALRLTVAESTVLAGPGCPPDVVRRLHAATEGWPAGTQLAVRAAANATDPTGFLAGVRGSQKEIAQYLMEEVLDQFDTTTRRLLIDTSVADRLTPELATALSGLPDAGGRLRELADQHLFVTRVGTTTVEYRYHPFLADLLLDMLADDDGHLRTQQWKAGQWFDAHGDVPAAIDHYLDAGALDEAGRLVEANLDRYVAYGRAEVLLAWWSRLPPVALPYGWWELTRLWTLARAGRYQESARGIECLVPPGDDPFLVAELHALRAFLAFRAGHLPEAEVHANASLELVRHVPDRPLTGPGLAAAILSRVSMFRAGPERALELSLVGAELADDGGPPRPAFLGPRSHALWACGRRADAVDCAREAIAASLTAPEWLGGGIDARLVLAAELEQDGRVDAAVSQLELAIGQARHLQLPVMEVVALVDLAAARARNGDVARARLSVAEADRLVRFHAMSPDLVRWVAAATGLLTAGDKDLPVVRLTEREREILECLPTRLTKAEIADQLFVSVNTVKHHTKSLYRKLGAVNRDEAIRAARTAQLLD